jgi:hypothetical protein
MQRLLPEIVAILATGPRSLSRIRMAQLAEDEEGPLVSQVQTSSAGIGRAKR